MSLTNHLHGNCDAIFPRYTGPYIPWRTKDEGAPVHGASPLLTALSLALPRLIFFIPPKYTLIRRGALSAWAPRSLNGENGLLLRH